jgi:predicted ATPase
MLLHALKHSSMVQNLQSTYYVSPNLLRTHTIIIDEPELGLHPAAITKLSGMVQRAAKKGCQIILATQSGELINHFQPEDIITIDQRNGESQLNRLNKMDLEDWLEDYTLGEL